MSKTPWANSPIHKMIQDAGVDDGSSLTASTCSAFSVELALELSSFVHERCKDVPHDIGIHLATIAEKHLKPNQTEQEPQTENDQ